MEEMEKNNKKWVWCLHCGRAFKYDGGMECVYNVYIRIVMEDSLIL